MLCSDRPTLLSSDAFTDLPSLTKYLCLWIASFHPEDKNKGGRYDRGRYDSLLPVMVSYFSTLEVGVKKVGQVGLRDTRGVANHKQKTKQQNSPQKSNPKLSNKIQKQLKVKN